MRANIKLKIIPRLNLNENRSARGGRKQMISDSSRFRLLFSSSFLNYLTSCRERLESCKPRRVSLFIVILSACINTQRTGCDDAKNTLVKLETVSREYNET